MVVKAWVEQELRKERGKRVVNLYAQMKLNNCLDFDILGNVYRPKEQIPAATVKRFIKQEGFSQAVNDEIVKILVDKGITKQWLIEQRKAGVIGALADGRYNDLDKLLDKFEGQQDMNPSVNKTITTHTLEAERQLENKMLEKIEAKRIVETPNTKQIDEDNEKE